MESNNKYLHRILHCIVLLNLFFSIFSFAQNKSIIGSVINDLGALPLEGVFVTLMPENKTTITDENGNFIFNSSNGSLSFTIELYSIGFEKKIITNEEYFSNKVIRMKPVKITELKEVIISSSGVSNQYKQISKLDIKMRGVNNSQEILRLVPGLFIGQHQGGGKAEQIFLRGFDCDHGTDVSLSVDGMPINMVSHGHGQGYADAHFIIPETIETVDFKKGAYYAEKGNFDTAGFVDFKTANSFSQNLLKVEGGMFNSKRIVGIFNLLNQKQIAKQQSWYVASEYNYSDGYFDNPQNFYRFNFFTKYKGRVSKNSYLQLSASTLQSKWNASGQIPERAVDEGLISFYGAIDPTEGGFTSRSNFNSQLVTTLKDGGLLKNQVYYSNYEFDLHTNFTFFLNDPINGDQIRQKENRNLIGHTTSYTKTTFFKKAKLTSEFGMNTRLDLTNNSQLSNTVDRTVIITPYKLGNITEFNTGLYVSESIKFNEKWSANLGLRFDQFYNQYFNKLESDVTLNGVGRYKAQAHIVSPKLSLNYQANSKTQFYFASGRGFHSNDTRAVVVTNGKEILPPAIGFDIGTVYKPTTNLLLHCATWMMDLKQEFVYSGDGGNVEITGATRRIGVDLSLRYEPIKNWFVDFDGNYAHGRYKDEPKGQNRIPLAPVISSTGGITYKKVKGFNGSLRYRYLSNRPAVEDYSLTAQGYFVTDGILSYTQAQYEVGLKVNNIFNTKWKETQFATETRLQNETAPVTQICFTPGTKFQALLYFAYYFK